MKRFSFVVMVVALVAMMSSAVMAEGMMFGVKGGLNLANLTGDIEENEMKLAFGGGVFMNYAFTEAFSVQPEILFMLKGTKWSEGDDDYKWNFTYIDIPVLAKYTIPMEGAFAPCVFAGPYLGILMSATDDPEFYGDELKDNMKSMDFGIVFGAGFDYAMGESGAITFDARYALGLSKLNDDDSDESVKNSGIMFMAGYAFAF